VDLCDPETGQCAVRAAADGTRCEDGDLCTRGDACLAGACEAGDALTCVIEVLGAIEFDSGGGEPLR
jgi:2-keto-4-pentenoate hydratase